MYQLRDHIHATDPHTHAAKKQSLASPSVTAPLPRRALGLVAAVLLMTGLLATAPARAQSQRPQTLAGGDPVLLKAPDYCVGFDVLITYPTFNQYIIQESESNGVVTYHITGHATALVTNVSTGKSIKLNISGPGKVTFNTDGSFSAVAAGPNLLWTESSKVPPGVPTISYTTGSVEFAVDTTGQTISYQLAGGSRQTDICALLATP